MPRDLRERLGGRGGRRRTGAAWLDAQLVALETQAAALAGEPLPYLDHVDALLRLSAAAPPRRRVRRRGRGRSTSSSRATGRWPTASTPGTGGSTIAAGPARRRSSTGWWRGSGRVPRRSFGLPDGEDLRVSLVTDQPWSGYNWYDGGRRSRVDINTDLPVRARRAHRHVPPTRRTRATTSSTPGRRPTSSTRRGRLEASILLINTPECLISEGLADLGHRFASPDDEEADLLVELFERAGLAVAADPAAARDAAERTVALAAARRDLSAVRGNAAILRHADGRVARGGPRLPP